MGRNKMVANFFLHTVLMYISYFLLYNFDNLLLIEQKLINLNSIAKLELVLEVHSNVYINSIDNLSTKTHHLWIIYRYIYLWEYKQIKCFLPSSHSVTERCNHWRKIHNQPTPPLFFFIMLAAVISSWNAKKYFIM